MPIAPLKADATASTPPTILHISSREVPPGGMSYKIAGLAERAPGLAWVGPFNDSETLLKEVNRREAANGLPPSNLAQIEDQICQRLPPGWCRDSGERPPLHAGSLALTLNDVVAGTKALAGWFRHGSVDQSEIVRRTYICNDCPENRPIAGCTGCAANRLHGVMNLIVVRPLPSDAVLHACTICHCSLKAKVRMKLDDLPPLTPDQRARLPERCWLNPDTDTQRNDPRV